MCRFPISEIRPTGIVLCPEGLVSVVVLYDKDRPKDRVQVHCDCRQRDGGSGSGPHNILILDLNWHEKELPIEPKRTLRIRLWFRY